MNKSISIATTATRNLPIRFRGATTAPVANIKIGHDHTAARESKRVLVVDQFPGCRMALADLLGRTRDLILCGEAENSGRALKVIRRLKPDVVVTEIFSQQDLQFVRHLHRRHPRLRILVLSYRDEDSYAPLALEAGADGFLAKDTTVDEVVEGIRGALSGRMVLSRRMRARLLAKCVRQTSPAPRCAVPRWARN